MNKDDWNDEGYSSDGDNDVIFLSEGNCEDNT